MDIQQELRDLGINPTQGQHFINNEIAVRKFLNHAETKGKTVLEIGSGTGSITEHLDAEKVYAVEKDTVMAQHLQSKEFDVKLEVLNDDFLQLQIPEDVEYILGNLPFQLSSEILEKVGELQISSVFIVQEELADKVVASPGESDFNFFSFKMSYFFIPVKAGVISSRNYTPEPEVQTAVLKLFPEKNRHGVSNEEEFLNFAKAVFTHRRKKLRNAIVDARNILGEEKDFLKEIRDDLPHSETKVYELEVLELSEVFEEYQSKPNASD